jgi:hypothetical protein
MSELKYKECRDADCTETFPQYNSLQKYCSAKCKAKNKKSGVGIKPMSDKMQADYIIYRPIRDRYMDEHPVCEVKGCCKPSVDLHHKARRTGYADEESINKGFKLLWDTRYFMAICRSHHTKCDEDPVWAEENGYIVRL